MNNMLPRPLFWDEAAKQLKTRFSMLGELLILLLLYFLAGFVQTALLSLASGIWLLGGSGVGLMEKLMAAKSVDAMVYQLVEAMPDWLLIVSHFAAGAVGAAALIYCRRFQYRSFASMGLRGPRPLAEYGMGWILGACLAAGVLVIGLLAGGYQMESGALRVDQLGLLLAALLGCAVQAAGEELLIRGYYAPSLGAHYPLPVALAMSTVATILLHSGSSITNMSTVNTLLLSLVLGIWVIKRGNLWSAWGVHGAWLFVQNYLFGYAPAGEHRGVSLMTVDTDPYRTLLSGGSLGPQASICTTIVLLAALGVVLALKAREPAPPQPPRQDEQAGNFL